jgi:hypothetical protein
MVSDLVHCQLVMMRALNTGSHLNTFTSAKSQFLTDSIIEVIAHMINRDAYVTQNSPLATYHLKHCWNDGLASHHTMTL